MRRPPRPRVLGLPVDGLPESFGESCWEPTNNFINIFVLVIYFDVKNSYRRSIRLVWVVPHCHLGFLEPHVLDYEMCYVIECWEFEWMPLPRDLPQSMHTNYTVLNIYYLWLVIIIIKQT